MAQQGGFGLDVQIDVSGSLAALVHVLDMDLPEFMKFVAEMTGHDSPGGYYEAVDTGKKRVQPFTVTLGWDAGASSHAAVLAAFNSTTPVTFKVADPAGDEEISFECHIERVKRIAKQQEGYKAEVTIHPTGQPTIA